METAEIIRQLENWNGEFPLAALEAATDQKEEITPELLRLLEDIADRAAQPGRRNDDDMAVVYAMLLLAQFRETRAYPLVLRIASLPAELADALMGAFTPQCLGRVLASVCGGDMEGIQSLIENEDADEWVRGAALVGLMTLVATGQKSRDEIVSYFVALFRGKLAREHSNVWDELAVCSRYIYPEELLEDVDRAYEECIIDPDYISLDDIKSGLARGKDRVLADLAGNLNYLPVADTVEELEWWDCFQSMPEEDSLERADNPMPAPVAHRFASPPPEVEPPPLPKVIQVKYAQPKTGRNEPCPCGSGKKYKKCCGA